MSAETRADRHIRLSVPETISLVSRAARGAGFSWGEADEIAAVVPCCSAYGLAWEHWLLAALRDTKAMPPQVAANTWSASGSLCPLRTGIALLDFAALPTGLGEGVLTLESVKHWPLLTGFVAGAAKRLQTAIRMEASNDAFTVGEGHTPSINRFADGVAIEPTDVRLTRVHDPQPTGAHAPARPDQQMRPIPLDRYDALNALAMKTTVPTSEISISGAGSGGSDND